MIPGSANPLLLAGAAEEAGYAIERSLRFNSADSAYLSRTPSTAGNRKTWTWAGWVKRANLGTVQHIFEAYTDTDIETFFRFDSDDGFKFGTYNGGYIFELETAGLFRDPGAWYHFVVVLDTTQATASNRVKIYVNGSLVTAFSTATYPSQNSDHYINNSSYIHYIGKSGFASRYLNGYLADVHFIDGQALDPTSFGEFDADTGIWNPIEFTPQATPNDGTTWSNSSVSGSWAFSDTLANAFDGNPASVSRAAASQATTITLIKEVPFTTSVKLTGSLDNAGGQIYVKDGTDTFVNVSSGFNASSTVNTVDITSSLVSPIKAIKLDSVGNGYARMSYLEIDGVALVDGNTSNIGVNGFHLPFSDNSSAAALGDDTSGNNNDWTVNNIVAEQPLSLPAVAFDGPTDGAATATGYLTVPSSADFNFGTGDFTWEAFIYGDDWTGGSANDDQLVIAHAPSSNSDISGLYVDGGQSYYYSNKASSRFVITGPVLSDKKWYHIAASRESGTLRLFVDGVSVGSASYTDTYGDAPFVLGRNEDNDKNQFRGLISNFRVVKGTALYTSNFTRPTAPLTAVANTKLLCCQSSSSATAATVSPGTITTSGSVSATTKSDSSAANDSLVDVPQNGTETDSGLGAEVRGNYATWNPLVKAANVFTYENGNLEAYQTRAVDTWRGAFGSIAVSSGKWYWEVSSSLDPGSSALTDIYHQHGIALAAFNPSNNPGSGGTSGTILYSSDNGNKVVDNSSSSYGSSFTTQIIGVALDLDAQTVTFYRDNVSQGSISLSGTTLSGKSIIPVLFGAVNAVSGTARWILNAGQRPFAYTAPSGFKALCTANLPAPTVEDGSDYMDVKLYTGNGTSQTISGFEFSPDFVWLKNRADAEVHGLFDQVRGADNWLSSNTTGAETDYGGGFGVTSFTSDGFVIGNGTAINGSGEGIVAWTWDAGSSTVSNTDGSITSQVRAQPIAGCSIVTWTASGTNNDTVGHGLGVVPDLMILKSRDAARDWLVYTQKIDGSLDFLFLNTTAAKTDSSANVPTSTTFSVIGAYINTSGEDIIAYCFAAVEGYSAFGSYTGNGSTDGPFVYTGFRPRWLMYKRTSSTGNWVVIDSERNSFNPSKNYLLPNTTGAEGVFGTGDIDLASNGYKIRATSSDVNASGSTYIYAAFAEHPFRTSRAR